MGSFALVVPMLGCAAMMGGMMWMMGRGNRDQKESSGQTERSEIDALRDEVATLRDEAARDRASDG